MPTKGDLARERDLRVNKPYGREDYLNPKTSEKIKRDLASKAAGSKTGKLKKKHIFRLKQGQFTNKEVTLESTGETYNSMVA